MEGYSLDYGMIEDMMNVEAADVVESVYKPNVEDLGQPMVSDEFAVYHIKKTDGSIHEVIIRRIY